MGTVAAVQLHPDVQPLAMLLGSWTGEGEGHYPTIEPFRYREEVQFGHAGKPFLSYRQATVAVATGLAAHAEAGYLRTIGDNRIELVLAHPTGIAEIATGSYTLETVRVDDAGPDAGTGTDTRSGDGQRGGALHLALESVDILGTPTAKEVKAVTRTIEVTGDILRYDLSMAAVGQPLQHHLHAELHRQDRLGR